MKTLTAAIATCLLALGAAPAGAQTRGYISLNVLTQPANPKRLDHFTFQENAETAIADVSYPAKLGIGAEAGAGRRFWKQLGAGLAVSYVSSSGDAQIEASIPHPFVFGQPRAIAGTQGGVARSETTVHVQVLYFLPAKGKLRTVLSAGPSHVTLQQDVVDEIVYSDAYPYDTAAFTRAGTTSARASAVGFNVGADIRWMYSRSFGVGAVVRFTRAHVDLDVTGRTVGADTGGLQAGAGVRFGF